LLSNIYEAVEGCLSVDAREIPTTGKDKVLEIAVRKPSAARILAGCWKSTDGRLNALPEATISIPNLATFREFQSPHMEIPV